ncbi:MAG: hypothetical protein ACI9FG_002039 [Crocinitomicaceae bacterium]|jgi:hypothetical protein
MRLQVPNNNGELGATTVKISRPITCQQSNAEGKLSEGSFMNSAFSHFLSFISPYHSEDEVNWMKLSFNPTHHKPNETCSEPLHMDTCYRRMPFPFRPDEPREKGEAARARFHSRRWQRRVPRLESRRDWELGEGSERGKSVQLFRRSGCGGN